MRASPSTSSPRVRVRPRFCLCRVMRAGSTDSVTLATVSWRSIQKRLARSRARSERAARAPASTPLSRSASRPSLAAVKTLPTRNER